MNWVVRLDVIEGNLDHSKSVFGPSVFVFDDNPKVARHISDFLWIVEEQLLVEVWELRVLNDDGHHLILI